MPVAHSASAAPQRTPPSKLRTDGRLVPGLKACVATASGDDGCADLSAVGHLMRKQHPDFDPRNWGYAKFSELVEATELFDVEALPAGGMRVRSRKPSNG